MMTALEIANREQRDASNPATSAFVSASAGSGKTKLLTDRLLRLMLAGTPPARILCLTYTKAAAAEMAIRLNKRLGAWVVMEEKKLHHELAALDVPADKIDFARKLFADVLDLPGGMRIGTIHAFCQSLLRRFPLEAGLSPHFQLADDNDSAARLREARETVLADAGQRDAILHLAAETDEQSFAVLTAKFCAGENELQNLLRDISPAELAAMQRDALGAAVLDDAAIIAAAVTWKQEDRLRAALQTIANLGPPKAAEAALRRLDWLAMDSATRAANWAAWQDSFFGDKKPYALASIIGKKLAETNPALGEIILAEQNRIAAVEDARKAAKLCALNAELLKLIAPIISAEGAEKNLAAALSYADLISYTGSLLQDPGAAWILYKLDGGIDHLLLDEVQDTAPAQWNIADAIAAEFFAGAGARDVPRSIFAVGDAKQSIFSFQGADLESFEHYRAKFRNRVKDSGNDWLDGTLSVSFRSTAPVLGLVDAVFAAGFACQGVSESGGLEHGVSRIGQAGAVTLWPLTQAALPPDLPPWAVPDDYAGAESAQAGLARSIAAYIKNRLDSAEILPSRNRAIEPGDFLLLVRRRDALVTAITAACKAAGIPIAGADRVVLTAQQAVSDLLALCDALLLPEDDLAFGQFLASPLGGLSDESLMQLALDRRGSLAAALFARRAERADWQSAQDFFGTLRNRVDFISTHALLAEALFTLGGRARLLQRLGAEAAEPVDELLAEALAYARREPESLQNFAHWLRQSGASIKREADAGGTMVRIMTVHGAKGLQAPIVILPDTTAVPKPSENLFWLNPPSRPDIAVPVFCPRTDLRSSALAAAAAQEKTAMQAEQNRLLYVALTRAEDELLVCGTQGKQKLPDNCWYNAITAGFARLAGVAMADGISTLSTPQMAVPDRAAARQSAATAVLPAWAGAAPGWAATPPNAETTRPEPLAPSRNTDDDAKRAIAASPLGSTLASARQGRQAALAKGRMIHALLQHLPDIPAPQRAEAAAHYLRRQDGLNGPAQAEILEPVLAILQNPALAPLFGPVSRAEIPLAGVVGDVEIGGLVDRLAVLPEEILLADYKTDRQPPASLAEIPPAYLRQLAAYQAILSQIYPARRITCRLIFTANAVIMDVPPEMLARHAPAAAPLDQPPNQRHVGNN
jgi:ATP-dependent helicase/nuclease subunit A